MRLRKALLFMFVGGAAAAVVATTQSTHDAEERAGIVHYDPALVMSPHVKDLITRSCADCHSMSPHLPWYSHLPPVSWLLERDIQNARKAMNLSQWSSNNGKSVRSSIGTLAAMCADVQSGRMPYKNYLWMHPEAKMSKGDTDAFCGWTAQQMTRTSPSLRAPGK